MESEPIAVHIAVLAIAPDPERADLGTVRAAIELATAAGHQIVARAIVKDSVATIRDQIQKWIAQPGVDVIIASGGIDSQHAPAALKPLITAQLPGFTDLFRWIAYQELGAGAMLSNAEAAQCGSTFVFVLPAAVGAVRSAMEKLVIPQLDHRTKPRNLVMQMPRMREASAAASGPVAVPVAIANEKTAGGVGLTPKAPAMPNVVARKKPPDDPTTKVIDRAGLERQIALSRPPSQDTPTKPIDLALLLPKVPPGADEILDADEAGVDVEPPRLVQSPIAVAKAKPATGPAPVVKVPTTIPLAKLAAPRPDSAVTPVTPVPAVRPPSAVTPTQPTPVVRPSAVTPTQPTPVVRPSAVTPTQPTPTVRQPSATPPVATPIERSASAGPRSDAEGRRGESIVKPPVGKPAMPAMVRTNVTATPPIPTAVVKPPPVPRSPTPPVPAPVVSPPQPAGFVDTAPTTLVDPPSAPPFGGAARSGGAGTLDAEPPAMIVDTKPSYVDKPPATLVGPAPVPSRAEPRPTPAPPILPALAPAPPAPRPRTAAPPTIIVFPQKKRGRGKVVAIAALLALFIGTGVGAVLHFVLDRPREKPPVVAENDHAVAPPTPQPPPPAPPAPPAPVAATPDAAPPEDIEVDPTPAPAPPPPQPQHPPVARPQPAPHRPPPAPVAQPAHGTPAPQPPPEPTPPEPKPQPVEHASPAPADPDCDEVSCVLEKYARPCCARYKPADTSFHPKTGELPDELDRYMVKSGVEHIKPKVISCGERTAAKGTVKVSVKVDGDGSVRDVSVAESPDTALGDCVAGAMRNARFAKTANGGAFTYPFVF